MISEEDAGYRLDLARAYLFEAQTDQDLGRWRSAVEGAQLTIENAAKAIVACFGPVPRSHDVADRLQALLDQELSDELRNGIEGIIPIVTEYGTPLHIRVTYGDERAFRSPWELFGEDDAAAAIRSAHRCLGVAQMVWDHFFGEAKEDDMALQ